MNTLFAIKTGMTGKFSPQGERYGGTVLQILPMQVLDLRTKEKHGYDALRFKITDSRFKKKYLTREVRTEEVLEPKAIIKLEEVIKVGDTVAVTGITKGKGFAGGVKRHGFHGGPRTHGQSDRERAPGASGTGTTPGRVLKGKRMAGHLGVTKVTISGLKVMETDPEKSQVTIKGAVPGADRFTLLTIVKKS